MGPRTGGLLVTLAYAGWRIKLTLSAASYQSRSGETSMNDAMLREQVRTRLSNGLLRREAVGNVVAGYGTGTHACAGCGTMIRASEVAYRLHFGPSAAAIHMHYYCFVVWDRERLAPDVPAGELSDAVTRNSSRRLRAEQSATPEVFRRF
jgi:hypothetical protein